MNQADVQAYVEERVDMQSAMEWIIAETFFSNTDTGNIRRYRIEGEKWNWRLFDLDWALTDGYKTYNRLELIFSTNGHGSGNNFWTHLTVAIRTSDKWRRQFIELYAQHLNDTFKPERLTAIFDAMAEEIRPEMERNCQRWTSEKLPQSAEKWEKNLETFKERMVDKHKVAMENLKSYFGLGDERMHELFPEYY